MPGLFGILDSSATTDIQAVLEKTQAAIAHFPWYSADTWRDPQRPVGLGRSVAGVFNREPQPLHSADGQIVAFMSGELYRTAALRRKLEAAGTALPAQATHLDLVLAAFRAFGTEFPAMLDGAFIVAIYERDKGRLILANDRFGQYPTYIYREAGRLVFAPEVKGVLCAPFVPRKLNVAAAAQFFRFQQLLETTTFHEGIEQFPYATLAEFDLNSGQWTQRRYWDWDHIAARPEVTFNQAVEELGARLRDAVQELSSDALRPGVFLSGGLDSRAILGFMTPRATPIVTATFGVRESRDVYYAERIAAKMGSQHHWFDLSDGRWVMENVDLHLKLTEGFQSWIHMHGITMLPKLRERMDYNLTGWDGGTVMGHRQQIRPPLIAAVDDLALTATLYHEFGSMYTWPGLNEGEERQLYTPEFGGQALGRAFDSMAQAFKRYAAYRADNRAEYFYIRNHCFRMTQNMVTVGRSHLEMRFPFWDYALIDFMYAVKPLIRDNQMLYRHILTRMMPALANIPYDKQEYLPSVQSARHRLHALSVRARRRLKLYPNRPTLYADYENYLRRELRGWAEGILYDPRTEARGIFNMPFVRSLMARHLSGQEEWTIGKIAPLITFEMMMRRYFD
jgi:asparagine synthase (glutamine-hydrolysing)